MKELSRQYRILVELASLCSKPLPTEFVGTEVNNRLWNAFELGKEWQECHLTSKFSGLAKLAANQKDLSPEIQNLIDKHFWELV